MTTSSLVRGALALACVGLLATGCGNVINTDMIGTTGVAVSEQGDPEAVIVVCRESIDQLTLSGDRTGLNDDEQNPRFGTWTPDEPISRGVYRISLTSPTDGWSFTGPFEAFKPGRTYILSAGSTHHDVETSQVNFHGDDLDGQDSSTVLLDAGRSPAETLLISNCERYQEDVDR